MTSVVAVKVPVPERPPPRLLAAAHPAFAEVLTETLGGWSATVRSEAVAAPGEFDGIAVPPGARLRLSSVEVRLPGAERRWRVVTFTERPGEPPVSGPGKERCAWWTAAFLPCGRGLFLEVDEGSSIYPRALYAVTCGASLRFHRLAEGRFAADETSAPPTLVAVTGADWADGRPNFHLARLAPRAPPAGPPALDLVHARGARGPPGWSADAALAVDERGRVWVSVREQRPLLHVYAPDFALLAEHNFGLGSFPRFRVKQHPGGVVGAEGSRWRLRLATDDDGDDDGGDDGGDDGR